MIKRAAERQSFVHLRHMEKTQPQTWRESGRSNAKEEKDPRELSRLLSLASLPVIESRRLWPFRAVLGRIASPCYRRNPLSPVKHAAVSDMDEIGDILPLLRDPRRTENL